MTALAAHPEETRARLFLMLGDVCKFVSAGKTLESADDFVFCFEALTTEFPTMTLEEWRLVMDGIKLGKFGEMFNRLKVAEFAKCFRKIEGARADILEQQNSYVVRGVDDVSQIAPYDAEVSKLAWKMKNNPYLIPGKNAKDTETES
jgi:hypothetical protein